jgi:hypothetical protein
MATKVAVMPHLAGRKSCSRWQEECGQFGGTLHSRCGAERGCQNHLEQRKRATIDCVGAHNVIATIAQPQQG